MPDIWPFRRRREVLPDDEDTVFDGDGEEFRGVSNSDARPPGRPPTGPSGVSRSPDGKR